ncbi:MULTISPECIES: N-methyl-L-tryptophan oxidase [Hyphobacterium]|uniref:N-methyl-L-tryptophan oxidase n=1 Tax=Hyphobacterium vulgare TaxID=1736751 RepID=A0ABV6ZW10_9PROT
MYDSIVIGLGAMGSAAAWQMARRGASVLGLEQFAEGHGKGSSHGRTRVTRRIYSEGSLYMPLLNRAYALWAEMETESGETFLVRTGGLDIAPDGAPSLLNSIACAEAEGIAHEVLDTDSLRARWPEIRVPDGYIAVFAPESGQLRSDAANRWIREAARSCGAELRFETPVLDWRRVGDHIAVETASGTEIAKRVVIAAGAWAGTLLPDIDPALTVERQVVGWFAGLDGRSFNNTPVFQVEPDDDGRFYIQPGRNGEATKIGLYGHLGERGPEMRQGRAPDSRDEAVLRGGLARWLPAANGPLETLQECRFTRTADDRFIIGQWPEDEAVTLLSPCSGHGYKFAPAIGEAAAQLALGETPAVDLSPFAVTRFL